MSIRTYLPVPALSGGVSQQPAHARLPSQTGPQSNTLNDVSYGFSKRAGTEFDRKFTGPVTDGGNADLRIKLFRFSLTEEYFVVWGRAPQASSATSPVFRMFRVGGNEVGATGTLTISAAATTYMDANGADGSQLRFRQIGDHAYIINTTMPTALATSPDYAVERIWPTYSDMIGYSTTQDYYSRTTEHDDIENAGYFKYNYGTYSYAHTNFRTVSDGWSIPNGYWNDAEDGTPPLYYPSGFKLSFRRVGLTGFTGATWDGTALTLDLSTSTAPTAAATYVHRPGDQIFITGTGGGCTLSGWQTITAHTYGTAIFTLGNSSSANGTANANSADGCRIGRIVQCVIDVHADPPTTMHGIAAKFEEQLRAAGLGNATCVWVPQSIGGAFQITSPWRGNNAKIYGPEAPDATAVGTNGDLTAAGRPFDLTTYSGVDGAGGVAPDSEDTATPESRWTRVAAPSQSTAAINATTMPHVLIRTAENTFTLGVQTWGQRTSGNATTAPGCALFVNGAKISDMAWFKERLVLIGGTYVAASKVGSETNFWPDDVADIIDSDVISRVATGPDTVKLDFAVPKNDAIFIQAEGGIQYEFAGGELLTPETASITPTTRYAAASVPPASATSQIFFTVSHGDYSALMEYYYDELRLSNDARNTTSHVPRYLPGALRSLVVSTNNQIVLALPDQDGDNATIYVYKYHYEGDRKVQSAWCKWDYASDNNIIDIAEWGSDAVMLVESTVPSIVVTGGADTKFTIASHGYSVGTLFSVTESSGMTPTVAGTHAVKTVVDANNVEIELSTSGTGTCRVHVGDYFIEKQPLSRQATPSGYAHPIFLDRQMVLYSTYGAPNNTWNLPATPTTIAGTSSQVRASGSTINSIVLPSGTILTGFTYSGNTIIHNSAVDYSALAAVLGYQPSLSAELSRPYMPADSGVDLGTPLTINSTNVEYADTGSLSISAVQTNVDTRTTTLTSSATPSTGTLQSWAQGRADLMTQSITDATPRPLVVTGLTYAIEYAPVGINPDRRSRSND